MPRLTTASLESEIAQRAVTAAAAAATTYLRPARFPRWVRRGLSMTNTLTAVGMAAAGKRRPAASQLGGQDGAKTVELVDGKPTSQVSATLLSASAAGMALVTSGLAMRVDKRVEKTLLKRGVARPRLWMALGAAVVSLAGPWVTEQLQAQATKLQEKALPKETLAATLADPLGTKGRTAQDKPALGTAAKSQSEPKNSHDTTSSTSPTSTTGQIEAGDPSRRVVTDDEKADEGDEQTER